MTTNYLQMMIDSLNKKKKILTRIVELNEEQDAILSEPVLDDEAFDSNMKAKGDCIDGLDKLEKAVAGYYDMILMDIQMPVMDGYDAAARIRRMKDEKKASIPIVAMTANAFAEDRQKAISMGMNDHVAKPIDMNVLLPVIAKYIR